MPPQTKVIKALRVCRKIYADNAQRRARDTRLIRPSAPRAWVPTPSAFSQSTGRSRTSSAWRLTSTK
eukprot:8257544-Pyramimonas_sp.AAC.1